MQNIVITAENLGKKYTIGHAEDRDRYIALRDILMRNIKSVWNKSRDLLSGRPIIQGDTLEDVWALKDVCFEIRSGETIGIIGRNGAGKSTLLKILSRITEPSEGQVTIKGRVASLLEVGTGFHPELTGRENIFLNGAILGMTRQEIKRKFDEIVAFAETEKYLDTPVKRYSSGMYVRLAFAVASHLEPEILLVDEVLAVGDAAFQKKCLGKMGDVAKEGRTVLFVSHNMGAINTLCPDTIWIDKGLLRAKGKSEEIVEMYLATNYQKLASVEFPVRLNVKGQIKSIRLLNEKGVETSDFTKGMDPTIKVGFVINQPVRGCHIACIVSTSDGYHLYSTADTDKNTALFHVRQPGEYLARVTLPTSFLNTGIYHVTIGIGIPRVEIFDRKEALSFTLHDAGDFGTLKEGSRRAGLLLVEAPWTYL